MTAQVPEKLIYKGKTWEMTSFPIPSPDHPAFVSVEPGDVPKDEMIVLSTACWRMFIGTWEIKDGKLYLVDIIGTIKLKEEKPLFADWFSGTLHLRVGEMMRYRHRGFDSLFEKTMILHIEKGEFIGEEIIDNRHGGNPHSPDQ